MSDYAYIQIKLILWTVIFRNVTKIKAGIATLQDTEVTEVRVKATNNEYTCAAINKFKIIKIL